MIRRNVILPVPVTVLLFLVCLHAGWATAAAPQVYENRWRSADIARRIDAGIEQHRKGDAAIRVVDADGKPIANAQIEVRQTGHEFLFGCNAFVLGQLKTAAENQRYEEAFLRLFNFATVPFYWEGTEPARGELRYQEGAREIWRRPPPDRYLTWAEKHGLTLKGHPLLWHAYNPAWLPKDAGELRELYRKRFREIAGRYAGKIPIWDVVNESQVCNASYPLYSKDRAYVAWAFAEASPLFPDSATLMINEVTSFNFKPAEQSTYFTQVRELLAQGTKIRGIGLQFHYFRREALNGYLSGGNSDPAKMLDLYEKLSQFKLPLYITEITIPSAGEGGEALQETVVRDHYRLWFSAPGMAGITWWNLGDGTAVKGENEAMGGLVDDDLKPKAAYRALDKLINEDWKTRVQTQTSDKGQANFRGFFGQYVVKVTVDARSQEFRIAHNNGRDASHTLVFKN